MEVTAEVLARDLNPAEFEFDAPADAIVVAAGAGAVGAEIAALSLTAGADADANVILPDEFPAGLSAIALADNRGATYYLASALASGEEISRTATLTVTLAGNANYTALEQTVPLLISALRQAAAVEGEGLLGPNGEAFGSKNVAVLRVGDYANATFARVDSESDAELLIDANSGQVAVRAEGISLPGVYRLVVDAVSPDYAGTARLEAVLTVRAPDAPDSVNTIPLAERRRALLAVAGYSGSVAFYAAGGAGATLQTPTGALDGFSLGANGAGADFVSPEGFTLFVDEGQLASAGDSAATTVNVTARIHGFDPEDIALEVVVSALAAAEQAELRAAYDEAFSHPFSPPSEFGSGATFVLAGHDGGGADLFAVVNNNLERGSATPDVGTYEISAGMTHAGLLGTMFVTVTAEILAATPGAAYAIDGLTPERLTVADGYAGAVYAAGVSAADAVIALPGNVASGFALEVSPDARRVTLLLDGALAGGSERSGLFALSVVRQKEGAADGNYVALGQTLRATVLALSAPGQDVLRAVYDEEFSHSFLPPVGFESGGSFTVVGVAGGGGDATLFAAEGGRLVRGSTTPDAGTYEISAAMTHSDLIGTLTLTITAEISPATPDGRYAIDGLSPERITVAAGYGEAIYAVSLSAEGAVIALPDDVASGFALEVSPDSRSATLRLDSALAGWCGARGFVYAFGCSAEGRCGGRQLCSAGAGSCCDGGGFGGDSGGGGSGRGSLRGDSVHL